MSEQGRGLPAVWTDIPAAVEADFNRWYDEDHVAKRLALPGFLTARRYVSLSFPRSPTRGRACHAPWQTFDAHPLCPAILTGERTVR